MSEETNSASPGSATEVSSTSPIQTPEQSDEFNTGPTGDLNQDEKKATTLSIKSTDSDSADKQPATPPKATDKQNCIMFYGVTYLGIYCSKKRRSMYKSLFNFLLKY